LGFHKSGEFCGQFTFLGIPCTVEIVRIGEAECVDFLSSLENYKQDVLLP
jgi:hypothetical protein